MQQKTISFIQANIEVGQTQAGLINSSSQFLQHFYKSKNQTFLNFELIGSVEQAIFEKNPRFFSADELGQHSFEMYRYLTELSTKGLQKNRLNLNFGGDHSVALATVEASLRIEPNTLVIWIDAHADVNCAEESPSGNFHGMPAYYLMLNPKGRPETLAWLKTQLKPEQIIYIGLRDIDPFEKSFLEENKITYFTVHDIRNLGIGFVCDTLEKKSQSFKNIHLSFDIDSLDTSYPLCTGVPVAGGLFLNELHQILQCVSSTQKLRNFDIVEINPKLATTTQELKVTYDIAFQIIHRLCEERNPHASIFEQQSATYSAGL